MLPSELVNNFLKNRKGRVLCSFKGPIGYSSTQNKNRKLHDGKIGYVVGVSIFQRSAIDESPAWLDVQFDSEMIVRFDVDEVEFLA